MVVHIRGKVLGEASSGIASGLKPQVRTGGTVPTSGRLQRIGPWKVPVVLPNLHDWTEAAAAGPSGGTHNRRALNLLSASALTRNGIN